MRRYGSGTQGRVVAAGAALAMTLAVLSLVDRSFGPMPASFVVGDGAAAPLRSPIEVAIQPARIEVVGVRSDDVAQRSGPSSARPSGS
jgi:hypothetical protein